MKYRELLADFDVAHAETPMECERPSGLMAVLSILLIVGIPLIAAGFGIAFGCC